MDGNALNVGFNAQNFFCGIVEGKVMNRVTAVEQSAINVEEIGVGCVPAEAGAHEYFSAGGIWQQNLHLGFRNFDFKNFGSDFKNFDLKKLDLKRIDLKADQEAECKKSWIQMRP
jgi:hypothetical protein